MEVTVMSKIQFKDVTKIYENKKTVIENLNLEIEDGSFTVLVGPSGCGKTTVLRMVAGLEEVTKGNIFIGDEDVTFKEPGDRGIAMVFQNYALYPHMTVRENIEFGLKNAKVPKEERQQIVKDVIQFVGLDGYENVKPSKLSGGQRQRVALARAISKKPRVFLMDEPLSNLDAKLRNQMRTELIQLHNKLKSTFIYVTHDQIEAMTMGDKIVIMNEGKVLQVGSPREIYNNPQNIFVAQFIGDPGMNVIKLKSGNYFGFRPRKVVFQAPSEFEGIEFNGMVLTREILGSEVLYCIDTTFGKIMLKTNDETYQPGDTVKLYVEKTNLYFFDREENRIYSQREIEGLYQEVVRHNGNLQNEKN
jgi:sn-glycerol 3-phosphate transport system ATP-binding protein